MDKSPHTSHAKKAGKSLKQKRADKKAKASTRATDAVAESVTESRRRHR